MGRQGGYVVRIFILSGQFGRIISGGMSALIGPLSKHGKVTFHGWRDTSILVEINSSKDKIVVVGYSLGANMLGYIGVNSKRIIDLGVAYDPSKAWQGYPKIEEIDGEFVEDISNFKRVICFYNKGTWMIGGAKYASSSTEVEIVPTHQMHATVQFDGALHAYTEAAVATLAKAETS